MTKKIIYLLSLLLTCIHYKAFALITQPINFTSFVNFDSSEVVSKRDYKSDLNIFPNKITVYNYLDKNLFPTSCKQVNFQLFDTIEAKSFFYTEVKSTFVLIPRNLNLDINNYDNNNKLDMMEAFIARHSENFNYENSESFEELKNIIDDFDCNQEFIPRIKNALNGTHGLFCPEDSYKINQFDSCDRVLPSAITPIDSLLINNNIFNSIDTTTDILELKQLQFQILKTAQEAKTILFVPECASHTVSNTKLQLFLLPVAVIKEVYITSDQNICLTLAFLKESSSIYNSIKIFNKNSFQLDQTQHELTHINYKIQFNEINNNIKNHNLTSQYNNAIFCNFNFNFLEAIRSRHTSNQATGNELNPLTSWLPIDNGTGFLSLNITSQRLKQLSVCKDYNRHCYVKFKCCNKFWACHKCHNKRSTCGNANLTAKDAIKQKCQQCKHKQDIDTQNGQHCKMCGIIFAAYFCSICKHLSSKKDDPYHCKKCGICRYDSNNAYHCNACGFCLDISKKDKHKCRKNSAHDECTICLGDTFIGGCKILSCCRHKIHKKCFAEMATHKIKACPICRQNFDNK